MNLNPSPSNLPFITPNWEPPAGVHALMTTRSGGVSLAPYNSMNLGSRSQDTPAALQENHKRLRAWLSHKEDGVEPVFLDQVHGADVICLNKLTGRALTGDVLQGDSLPQADASYCTRAGIACTVRVADCMPVLLAVPGGVAAVHAGWRGLAGGVIEAALHRLLTATGQSAHHAVAWLGPCIGPDAFEVGSEVRDAFIRNHPDNQHAFRPSTSHLPNKWLADLPLLGQLALQRLRITQIYTDGRCTVGEEQLFYSYRRDQKPLGDTGRMAACVWIGE